MHACSPLSRLLFPAIMRGPNQRGPRIEFALETWGRNASARPLFSPFQAKCIQWTYDLNSKFCGFRRFWWLALSVLASNVNHTGNVLGSVHCNFPAVHVHNARGTCMAWLHGLGNCRSKKAFVPWASDHSEPFPFFCSLLVRRALSWLYWLTSGGWFLLCSGCFRWWTVKSAFFAFVIERTPSFQRFIVHRKKPRILPSFPMIDWWFFLPSWWQLFKSTSRIFLSECQSWKPLYVLKEWLLKESIISNGNPNVSTKFLGIRGSAKSSPSRAPWPSNIDNHIQNDPVYAHPACISLELKIHEYSLPWNR